MVSSLFQAYPKFTSVRIETPFHRSAGGLDVQGKTPSIEKRILKTLIETWSLKLKTMKKSSSFSPGKCFLMALVIICTSCGRNYSYYFFNYSRIDHEALYHPEVNRNSTMTKSFGRVNQVLETATANHSIPPTPWSGLFLIDLGRNHLARAERSDMNGQPFLFGLPWLQRATGNY